MQRNFSQLIAEYSPFLASLAAREAVPRDMGEIIAAARRELKAAKTEKAFLPVLRRAKKRVALLCAARDLSGVWDDTEVMRALSSFADFAVGAALGFLLSGHRIRAEKSGVIVIALGKWGAHELNYSSDIDLMVVFDPARSPIAAEEAQNFYIRLTRDLARLLDATTEDGYVFRTDLRLRPDPGAMPLAVSMGAAEIYYGSLGQNWERAAMIKARVVAGDPALGADFNRLMQAWIWRRNLDFAAIQDIHSIKRQINAKQARKGRAGAGANPFLGMNVKLCHGGIREIEFFAQTQQLIYGGRNPDLRASATLDALAALHKAGHITAVALKNISAAYLFLRRVEHRLQMQHDQQTHSLPAAAKEFSSFSTFMGYKSPKNFIADLKKHMGAVQQAYARLFTESASLSESGNLVFTGVEDDPETLETLRSFGFRQPEKITTAVRGWHHGRYRATRSERARQILTELTPLLLKTLGKTPQPDDAFMHFDQFLSHLPSGVPIFSMFLRQPKTMEVVAAISGTSPALAEYLGTHPGVLDGVLTRDFFGRLPDMKWLKKDITQALDRARDYEDALDIARRWAHEKRFHAGIHILKDLSSGARCRQYLSDIAEAVLSALIPHVEKDFARLHGRIKGGVFTVLALGSLGARSMFTDSDLDIVGIYEAPDKNSDGQKPLSPGLYYIRLMQRVISALSSPTAEGILYNVDARLRPAGDDGPIAVSRSSFLDYHRTSAWTWEHMSLTRARVVYGDGELDKNVRKIIALPRDPKKTKEDIAAMRAKMQKQFGAKDPKNRKGGLIDIMFIVQALILLHAHKTRKIINGDITLALAALQREKILTSKDARLLLAAYEDLMEMETLRRMTGREPRKKPASGKDVHGILRRVLK